MVQHVEVVLKKLFFHRGQFFHGHPLHLHGIVICPYGRKRRIAQIEIVRMRDGASALAAVGVVEHRHRLQGIAHVRLGQLAMGFFRQLAQARLPHRFALLDEPARHCALTLARRVGAQGETLARFAHALAQIDVACALAQLASEENYCRPVIDDGTAFVITGGRHPVVEAALGDTAFVPNDCDLSPAQRLWLLTGPNMAGKSTFLRQNAIIALMAQMGSFVPAASAHIGAVDRIFSRVGASDDLARGRSTFMVEMVEAAAILNQATDRSLVILDEIGRGTATFDGLSIAWACLEYLHDVSQCRGLFATHYHELTSLTAKLAHLSCHAMKVREWQGDIVFMHEVIAGAADESYGVHVAKLAGLPAPVIARAQQILDQLKKSETSGQLAALVDNLPLFASVVKGSAPSLPLPLKTFLDQLNPDDLSPKEALDALYALQKLYRA